MRIPTDPMYVFLTCYPKYTYFLFGLMNMSHHPYQFHAHALDRSQKEHSFPRWHILLCQNEVTNETIGYIEKDSTM